LPVLKYPVASSLSNRFAETELSGK